MHVMIIGAAGMLGRKLSARLASVPDALGRAIQKLTLADVVEAQIPDGFTGEAESVACDVSMQGTAAGLIASRPDIIFHACSRNSFPNP